MKMKSTRLANHNTIPFSRHDTTAWLFCRISINPKTFSSTSSKMNTTKWPNPIWMWNFCAWTQQFYYHQPEHHSLGSDSRGACRAEKSKKPDEPFECISYSDGCAKKWTTRKKRYCRSPTSVRASTWTIFWIWVSVLLLPLVYCRNSLIKKIEFGSKIDL